MVMMTVMMIMMTMMDDGDVCAVRHQLNLCGNLSRNQRERERERQADRQTDRQIDPGEIQENNKVRCYCIPGLTLLLPIKDPLPGVSKATLDTH